MNAAWRSLAHQCSREKNGGYPTAEMAHTDGETESARDKHNSALCGENINERLRLEEDA